MTDLALEIISMRFMENIVLWADLMAILTGGSVLDIIPMLIEIAVAMHLSSAVAFIAVHRIWHVMYIRAKSFILARIFISNTATMTGGTLILQIRNTLDSMALNKAAAYGIGTADVARSTSGMAFVALIVVFFVDTWV